MYIHCNSLTLGLIQTCRLFYWTHKRQPSISASTMKISRKTARSSSSRSSAWWTQPPRTKHEKEQWIHRALATALCCACGAPGRNDPHHFGQARNDGREKNL